MAPSSMLESRRLLDSRRFAALSSRGASVAGIVGGAGLDGVGITTLAMVRETIGADSTLAPRSELAASADPNWAASRETIAVATLLLGAAIVATTKTEPADTWMVTSLLGTPAA